MHLVGHERLVVNLVLEDKPVLHVMYMREVEEVEVEVD